MGLRIAILGLGDYGSELARRLVEMRAEVIAVDKNAAQVQVIASYVSKAVVADITRRRALEEAGVNTADVAVIATAERFEATVLAAHHLREFQGSKGYRQGCEYRPRQDPQTHGRCTNHQS